MEFMVEGLTSSDAIDGRARCALAARRGLPGGDEVPLELLALRLVRRARLVRVRVRVRVRVGVRVGVRVRIKARGRGTVRVMTRVFGRSSCTSRAPSPWDI